MKAGDKRRFRTNAGALVRGCEFREDKPQIELGENVQRAVITGNLLTGKERITNRSKGQVQVADNAEN